MQNMGLTYVLNRSWYTIQQKSGLFHSASINYQIKEFPITTAEWVKNRGKFFFEQKSHLSFTKNKEEKLAQKANIILSGKLPYFNNLYFPIPSQNRWHTHPKTGKIYSTELHYLQISDFAEGEDIKYIWEPSRFCYLYDLIRHDYHFDVDHAPLVFQEIVAWINENPTDKGPNYMSGQEIALRLLNWCFCLYYYTDYLKNNEPVWQQVMCSVYAQLHHIERNISFSEKFVRNNHLITEAACLFIYGILFPTLKESTRWKNTSQHILEQEALYQIAEDGSYLQYSMNYHRVIIQVYTWVIKLGKQNQITLSNPCVEALKKTLHFLIQQTHTNGHTPNYGANDGSLFFPLNDNEYRDFRPQLQALANTLSIHCFDTTFEDTLWINDAIEFANFTTTLTPLPLNAFPAGGYYNFRDTNTFTFIRCGSHIHRPSQADNLHLDIWVGSENVLRDCGTFEYNCNETLRNYFFGTQSHNTVKIGNRDQMTKGARFIWYFWTKANNATLTETAQQVNFSGSIRGFANKGKWSTHNRTVIKDKGTLRWKITDTINARQPNTIIQIWNPSPQFDHLFRIQAFDADNNIINPTYQKGYYSNAYGHLEETVQMIFMSTSSTIITLISQK